MGYSIAIDGPAGAGKSTIAKKVAAKKGCCYVDTGAIYRAMAYFLLENGVKGEETDRIAKKCQEANIRVAYEAGEQQVFLNGENVNSKIRTEEVGQMASKSAAVPQVRSWLIDLQRDLAVTQNVIMDFENRQREQTFRGVLSWDRVREKWKVGVKGGYIHTWMAYD